MVSCVIFVYSRLSPYFNTKYSYYIAIASIPSESLNSHWDRVSFNFENQTLRFTIAGVIFTTTRIYQPETDRMFVTTWFLVFQNGAYYMLTWKENLLTNLFGLSSILLKSAGKFVETELGKEHPSNK